MNKPELLAPAGSPEKLKVALKYGADAVYLAGQRYGLRAMADNFTEAEIARAVKLANKYSAKVYVVLNGFLHDEDLDGVCEYAKFLEAAGVSALIVSDIGVISLIRSTTNIPIHLSTQATCINTRSAKLWKSLGVTRVIVGRELSIAESGHLAKEADVEVEMFIHGAMCMAYSGNCVISNYTAGRDSNRGGCIQSCRFNYQHQPVKSFSTKSLAVVENDPQKLVSGYFMSSRDQEGLRLIPEFIKAGICSLKIEGRMKSVLYAATLCRAYRKVIDAIMDGTINESIYSEAEKEIRTIPHREYFNGNMLEQAGVGSTYEHSGDSATKGSHAYLGLIVDESKDRLVLRLSQGIELGKNIEFISRENATISWSVEDLRSIGGEKIDKAVQESLVTIPKTNILKGVDQFTVARFQI